MDFAPRVGYSTSMRHHSLLLAALLVALVPACGEDPEERFRDAIETLETAQEAEEQARSRVAERQEEADAAHRRLVDAQAELVEAESGVAEAQQTLAALATDDVLFRAVQSRLLEDRSLRDVAVAARVDAGVVTLSGSVPSAELAARARELAAATPGVIGVRSQIAVSAPAPATE